MVDPCCVDAAEYDDAPTDRDYYAAGGLSALSFCERRYHAGLELAGSLRALIAVLALVWVAVAWRRMP